MKKGAWAEVVLEDLEGPPAQVAKAILRSDERLASWFGASMLLMANSLIFFHMVRQRSVELPPAQAAAISVILILAGGVVLAWSAVSFVLRNKDFWALRLPRADSRERFISLFGLAFTAVAVAVFAWIACVITREAMNDGTSLGTPR